MKWYKRSSPDGCYGEVIRTDWMVSRVVWREERVVGGWDGKVEVRGWKREGEGGRKGKGDEEEEGKKGKGRAGKGGKEVEGRGRKRSEGRKEKGGAGRGRKGER